MLRKLPVGVFQLGTGQVTIERLQTIIDTIREAEDSE